MLLCLVFSWIHFFYLGLKATMCQNLKTEADHLRWEIPGLYPSPQMWWSCWGPACWQAGAGYMGRCSLHCVCLLRTCSRGFVLWIFSLILPVQSTWEYFLETEGHRNFSGTAVGSQSSISFFKNKLEVPNHNPSDEFLATVKQEHALCGDGSR